MPISLRALAWSSIALGVSVLIIGFLLFLLFFAISMWAAGSEPAVSPLRIFSLLACVIIVPIGLSCVFFILASKLKRASDYAACRILALLACLFFPLGTLFGLITFAALTRPRVKAMFNSATQATP